MDTFKQPSRQDAEALNYKAQVEARPCTCVRCPECRGTGDIYFSVEDGRQVGASHWDDLDEIETCYTCGGSGIVETCDRCDELNELDAMEAATAEA